MPNKKTESEILEFKEWKTTIPFANGGEKDTDKKRCVYGYYVGIGNEWGGKLLIGVDDSGTIVGTRATFKEDAKSRIFENRTKDWDWRDRNFWLKSDRTIDPWRSRWQFFTFNGAPLMRVDDQLLLMDHSTQKKRILMETEPDWSGLPCVGTTIDDLDSDALQFAKNKKADISKMNPTVRWITKTFLNQLSLLTEDGSPNNTCILFLWNKK